MRRTLTVLAIAALGAFGPLALGGTANACSDTVNVCPSAQECDGVVDICPMAHPDDCAGNVDVCLDFVGP